MTPETRLLGLPPVFDSGIRLLILGSFPSPASLAAQRYYGHPRNQFWRLLGAALGEPLPELDYSARLSRLLTRRVGIWDAFQSCVRPGALDADIRAGAVNDFPALLRQTPSLEKIRFNGQTAARFARKALAEFGFETVTLPSSSPAHTLPFEQKLAFWRAAFSPEPSEHDRTGTRPSSPAMNPVKVP